MLLNILRPCPPKSPPQVIAAASLAPDLGLPVSCLWVGPALLVSTAASQVPLLPHQRTAGFSLLFSACYPSDFFQQNASGRPGAAEQLQGGLGGEGGQA